MFFLKNLCNFQTCCNKFLFVSFSNDFYQHKFISPL
nr:MAG TPA: hypothetical protein [Caudoviricetes sp.]